MVRSHGCTRYFVCVITSPHHHHRFVTYHDFALHNSMLGSDMTAPDALATNPFVSTFGFPHLTMPSTPTHGMDNISACWPWLCHMRFTLC